MNSFFYRNRNVLLHVSFWSVYISFFIYQISNRDEKFNLWDATGRAAVHVIFNMSVAYLNYFVFLPRFLKRKKLGIYLMEFLVPFTILMAGRVFIQRYIVDGYTYQAHFFYGTFFVVQAVAGSLFIVIFVSLLRFVKDWFELEARRKELENEKLIAELSFLKEQINPHFLFNTLNNLYYLAYSKSENTTEVIAKLSQMMRYMIYESNYPQVALVKEIEYIENYISLERLRLSNQIPIELKLTGDPQGVTIAPLILITFLENAFKHGVNGNNPKAWVKVSIQLEGNKCTYTVENSKVNHVHSKSGEKSGIGLQNVKRRLELSYHDRFTLDVKDESDRYFVQLQLTLS